MRDAKRWLGLFGILALATVALVLLRVILLRVEGPPKQYDAIRPGMSMGAVEKELGDPETVVGLGLSGQATWQKGTYRIWVVFDTQEYLVYDKRIEKLSMDESIDGLVRSWFPHMREPRFFD